MPLTDEQAKQAYDRTLEEPEEKYAYWTVEVIVTRTYIRTTYGTQLQAEYQAMYDVGHRPDDYDEEEVRIADTYKGEN